MRPCILGLPLNLCVWRFSHFKKPSFGGMRSVGWQQWRSRPRRGEELLEISGSGLRERSSPQTPAPLHRSLIKDSLCPRAAPLSAEGPSSPGSECLPVLLRVDSAQLSLRAEQKRGFQSPGPLAFSSLWEIKRGKLGADSLLRSPTSPRKIRR